MAAEQPWVPTPDVLWHVLGDPRTEAMRQFDRGQGVPSNRADSPGSLRYPRTQEQLIEYLEDNAAALIDEAEHRRAVLGDAPAVSFNRDCQAPCCRARVRARIAAASDRGIRTVRRGRPSSA
jgi:hypothetical protein